MQAKKTNLIIIASMRDDEDKKFYHDIYFTTPNLHNHAVVVIFPTVETFWNYLLSMASDYKFKVLIHLHKRGPAIEIGEKLFKGILGLPTKKKITPFYISRDPIHKYGEIVCVYEPELNDDDFSYVDIPTFTIADLIDPNTDYSKVNVSKSNSTKETVVILTALPLELKEVKKFLSDIKSLPIGNAEDHYEESNYQSKSGKEFRIIVRNTGKLNVVSTKATSDAIKNFTPKYLFYLGIAGKLKDVEIGHVVIAEKVENYEPANVGAKQYMTRIFQGDADRFLLQIATTMVSDPNLRWPDRIKLEKHESFPEPEDHIGRIATGEKVLSDIDTEIFNRIRHDCSESLVVECEGGGFYYSCNQEKAKCLLIRGVSDKLKDKKFAEEFKSQPYAAACASAFLFELIDRL